MVQAMIRISEEANHIINIVKAKHNLKDKSAAIEQIVREYGSDLLEPQLKPAFIEKMAAREREDTVTMNHDAHVRSQGKPRTRTRRP